MGFRADNRAVSSLIAAVFVFGFIVIGLSIYQGVVVPNQNKQVEFTHSQAVQQDMLEARNAILRTKVTGEDGYVTVRLGTEYPARIIGINPPPASGTLYTTGLQPIRVYDQNGGNLSDSVCPGDPTTRMLAYQPADNVYLNAPTLVYENSVLYKQFRSGNVTMTGQTLVEGKTINVVPLKSQFSATSTGAVTFSPKAGNLKTTTVTHPTVTVPTRLSESTWESLLAGEIDPANVSVSGGKLTLHPPGKYDVRCGPVAVNQVPPSGARKGGGVSINPVSPGDVQLRDSTLGGSGQSKFVTVYLNNTANHSASIEQARISFFFDPQNQKPSQRPTYAYLKNNSTASPSAKLIIQGERKTLKPKVRLAGNHQTTSIEFEFDKSVSDTSFFVVQITYASGETGTYFVAPK